MDKDLSKSVELRLRAAVESSPSGLLMIDAQGRIVLANREIERLFGYQRDELLGQAVEILVPERFRGGHPGFRQKFFSDPQERAMGAGRDLFGRRKDGSEIPVEIGLNPIATEEGLFVLSSIVDISARQRAEEERRKLEEQLRQSQKMEAVGTLAGGIAHDFNNILGTIVGYAELVQQAVANRPEVMSDIGEILTAAVRGKRLIEQIMAFSRRQDRRLQALEFDATVSEATKLLRSMMPASIEIETKIDPSTPRILGDSTSIHQLLMNLGTNAVHAMPDGGKLLVSLNSIYVRDSMARTHPDLHEGLYAMLAVKDTGHGIDKVSLPRVFEPFFTTKGPGAGTGLGLAIVHRILKEHAGAVMIESVVGQGTQVKCFFPGQVGAEVPKEADPASEPLRGASQRVLYVEDEPLLARLGVRRLEALGYRVTVCTESPDALAKLRLDPTAFDIVVTDYWMPQLTGMDLARAIHTTRSDLPIILLTGLLEELPPEKLQALGIRAVLNKPVTTLDLAASIHAIFQTEKGS